MEISHRSAPFVDLAQDSERDLRSILEIPEDYAVLFLQGGAQTQFSMVPLNLLGGDKRADYIDTGYWSQLAIKEAKRYADVNVAASGEDGHYLGVPAPEAWVLDPRASYVHYTPNETIQGVEFRYVPDVGEVPLVADMSSNILSAPVDISKFGLIYAGAQKNIGPAGLALVIVRKDLFGRTAGLAPKLFNYEQQANSGSMMNTVPTFAWYVASLVFKWLIEQGGVSAMEIVNRRKAEKLYRCIDDSNGFYRNDVDLDSRSRMNVPFYLADDKLEPLFLQRCDQEGLLGLKGHRAVGGVRASIYNAVPEESVDALVEFMRDFQEVYG